MTVGLIADPVERVLDRLDAVAPRAGGHIARCPAHDDGRPSLKIDRGDDGRALLRCYAGCEPAAIVDAVGLAMSDLYPPSPNGHPLTVMVGGKAATAAPATGRREIATYDYSDERGELLFQTVRYEPKDFRQRHPDGKGGWVWNLQGVRRVLYRLPDVIAAAPDVPIYLVEGEKDADELARLGFVATTSAMGAKAPWKPEYGYAESLAGRDVVIVPDNDDVGRGHANKVAAALGPVARSVKVIGLPGTEEKGDVSDWLATGGSADRLRTLTRGAPTSLVTRAEHAETISWPDRQPIPPSHATPSLPPELLPPPFRTWLADVADIARLPLEMVAAPALVALGSVVGRSLGIRPWDFNDYVVVPNIWGCVVARPGWMKSFAVDQGLGPIGRLAATAREDYERRREEAEAEVAAIEAAMDDIKRRMREAAKKDQPLDDLKAAYLTKVKELREAKPSERRYMTHDATIEKLAELLRDNPRGMLVARDELYGLLKSFEKSGRENDRQFYLEGWGGTGSFTSDRIARGTIHVPALTLSIVGSIQPGRLKSLIDEAAAGGGADDGLMQRFQVTVWPDHLEPWAKPTRWPDGEARDAAFGVFKSLDTLVPSRIDAEQDREGTIPYLRFSALAQGVADEWHDELEHRLRSTALDASPAFAAHLAKYRSLMPSLALLFHLVDVGRGESSGGRVPEGSTRLAAGWCEYLEEHARKVYDVELDRGKAAARALVSKIDAGAVIDGQTVRDIYRHQWSGLRTDEVVIDGLNVLADLGWVRLASVSTGGRSSQVVHLHPELLEMRRAA